MVRLLPLLLLFFISCKKEISKPVTNNCNTVECWKGYKFYSTFDYDYIFSSMKNDSPIGPMFYYPDTFNYEGVVFNPHNPYEIAVLKVDRVNWTCATMELFNFCTGKQTTLANCVESYFDWSVKDWIVFKKSGGIYKIKPNGDSLTFVSNITTVNNVGRWNPSGTRFFFVDGGGGYKMLNEDGSGYTNLSTIAYTAIDWITDSTILGRNNNGFFLEYNVNTLTSTLMFKPTINIVSEFYSREKNVCFGVSGNDFLKVDMQSQEISEVSTIYPSYTYQFTNMNDYNPVTDKFALCLTRKTWLIDSTINKINVRKDVTIMNENGSNERMVLLK